MWWLQVVFLPMPSCPSCLLLLLILSFFPFVNITRSEMEFFFLFFVVEGAVNSLKDAMFSLVWLLDSIVAAFDFGFWVSSWRIWVAVAGEDLREDL